MNECKLRVNNLPKDFTRGDLSKLFGGFGELVKWSIQKDGSLYSRANVSFKEDKDAQEAI